MPASALAFALAAAVLHAVWNLALASRGDPEGANAIATATATVLFVPALWFGTVHAAAWPFIATWSSAATLRRSTCPRGCWPASPQS